MNNELTNASQNVLNVMFAIPQYANAGVAWGIKLTILGFGVISTAAAIGLVVRFLTKN